TEIIAALGRRGAQSIEARLITLGRILEIRPVAEVFADETARSVMVASRAGLSVKSQDIDVGRCQELVDLFQVSIRTRPQLRIAGRLQEALDKHLVSDQRRQGLITLQMARER